MKIGSLQRVVADDGVGRLRLVAETGTHYAITRKMLREAGVVRPLAGATFEFVPTSDRHAVRLRAIS